MNDNVIDNPAQSRFELAIGDELALAYYRLEGQRIVLVHTEVPHALSGQGIGTRLARGVFENLRARNMRVIVKCPFTSVFATKHPEYASIIDG